jgi:hypothetical protein
MKKHLKIIIFLCVAIGLIFGGMNQGVAQDRQQSPDKKKPREESQTLTDAQNTQVKFILSKYDASSLTADDAKAINRAFREASPQKSAVMCSWRP